MAARVVTQHPEAVGQTEQLVVPHPQVSAERIGQHKDRGVLGAVEPMMELDAQASTTIAIPCPTPMQSDASP
jgi:hypothetical protein